MNLLQHAMNIFGAGGGWFHPADIKPGFTVTKIDWCGCMATDRRWMDTGEIIRHQPSPHSGGKYPGIVVRWDHGGECWEPLQHFRKVNGELEVWS